MVTASLKWKDTCSLEENYDQARQHIKMQRHYLANKGPSSQSYSFSSSHVWMWELDYKESRVSTIDAFEPWCWRRLLRVPWTARRSNQSIIEEINPEYSLEGLMLKLKLQYFDPLMQRTDSLQKTLMLEKIEGGRRRGTTEHEMFGWHYQLNGHESELGVGNGQELGDGQGSLAWCISWGHKELDMTVRLNWTELLHNKMYNLRHLKAVLI